MHVHVKKLAVKLLTILSISFLRIVTYVKFLGLLYIFKWEHYFACFL